MTGASNEPNRSCRSFYLKNEIHSIIIITCLVLLSLKIFLAGSRGKILKYFCSIVASVMMRAPLMMCGELELLTFKGKINKISQQTFASVPCSEIIFRFRIQKIRSYLS